MIALISMLINGDGSTEQEGDFEREIGRRLTQEDTAEVEEFYSNLQNIYDDYSHRNLDTAFSIINKNDVPAECQHRIMSDFLLEATFSPAFDRQKRPDFELYNNSMGTANFAEYLYTSRWYGEFLSDIRYLKKGQLVCVLNYNTEDPRGTADSYKMKGSLAIYDLATSKCLSITNISAESTETFDLPNVYYQKAIELFEARVR